EKGYPAFRVENESRDVNVALTPPAAPPPYLTTPLRTSLGPPCRWDCGNPIGYWDDSYFNPRYDEWYIRSHAAGRVVATLAVKMLPTMADGAQDAAETEKQLRATYGAATFSPWAPPRPDSAAAEDPEHAIEDRWLGPGAGRRRRSLAGGPLERPLEGRQFRDRRI